jgi:hypothetical protein
MFLSLGDLLMMVDGIGPFLVLAGLGLYLLPTYISWQRHHHNAGPIFLVNLLLGWTLVGWVVALAWSATALHQREA